MPLLTGTWALVSNGHEGQINIVSVAQNGTLDFSLVLPGVGVPNSGISYYGTWDEGSQTITLNMMGLAPGLANVLLRFEGCQFQCHFNPPQGKM
jgi:hypothetical protein